MKLGHLFLLSFFAKNSAAAYSPLSFSSPHLASVVSHSAAAALSIPNIPR